LEGEGQTVRGPVSTIAAIALLQGAQPAFAVQPAEPIDLHQPIHRVDLEGLEAHVEQSMEQWGTAGLALGIVHNGEVIFLRGFGTRDVRTREPVDADTVFGIGSITKSFTAVLAGVLVDEGRISFDDRLVEHVPNFAVGDAYVTGAATLRDALSHRTGYDWRMDPLLFLSGASRSEVIDQMEDVQPHFPFRNGYGYSNVMYMVAGEALGGAAGATWDQAVADKIFTPLGMNRSGTTIRDLERQTNVATPHRYSAQGPKPISRGNNDMAGGAGSINSTARDMARYIQMLASDGKIGGQQFLKSATLKDLLTPHVDAGEEADLRPFTNFHAWGLGWDLKDYKGRKVASHGGIIDGMHAEMAFVPGSGFGVVVLTNTDGLRYLPAALVLNVLDRAFGGARKDWNTSFLRRGHAFRDRMTAAPPRVTGTRPSLPLTAYVGSYRGPHGLATVRQQGERLLVVYGATRVPLDHWQYDTFRGSWGGLFGEQLATFSLGRSGRPERLSITFIGDFERVAGRGAE
jgi:CubicO group peptidase (beta-lactamase class C family)